jgi:hypothetical protein
MSRFRLVLLSLLAVLAVGAVASASASALPNLEWEVCEKGGGAGTKFSTHICNSHLGGTEEWEWVKQTAGMARSISSLGVGPQKLIGHIGGVAIEIECTEVEDTGTIEGGKPGKDKGEVIYHGCAIKGAACGLSAKSPGKKAGVISLAVKTTLVENLAKEEGDRFEPASGTTFVEIELGKTEVNLKYTEACGAFPKVAQKVEGSTVGLAVAPAGRNLCEELSFTNPAQEGSTLKFGTEAALYVGKVEFELQNKWAFRCS